jgi:hypothetical protein
MQDEEAETGTMSSAASFSVLPSSSLAKKAVPDQRREDPMLQDSQAEVKPVAYVNSPLASFAAWQQQPDNQATIGRPDVGNHLAEINPGRDNQKALRSNIMRVRQIFAT